MNTRFDPEAYDTVHDKCTACNNPVVITHSAKVYCVRCNMHLPEWMVKK